MLGHLRNVKGHAWNHKRVHRISCELELNLRIKPRRRLKREKPEELTVPEAPNRVWSMDFMADRLVDGRQFRLLNVARTISTAKAWASRSIFHCQLSGSFDP